jgi:hypothetical protein
MREAKLTIHLTMTEPVRLEHELCPTCWCATMFVMIMLLDTDLHFIQCCANCSP